MKFFKGLHTDNHPIDQPEGTYRDAYNIVIQEQMGVVYNEPGITSTSLLPAGFMPIGSTILPDGRIVVFLASDAGESEIGIIQTDGVYETLVNDDRLNFSLDHPIDATVRMAVQTVTSQQFDSAVEVELEDHITVGDTFTVTLTDESPSPS